MEGYLLKEGHVRKNWKKRYFVLNATTRTLSYFKDETKLEKKGKIALDYGEVKRGDEVGSLITGKSSVCDTNRYILRVIDGETNKCYHLCAETSEGSQASRDNQQRWLEAIQTCITKSGKEQVHSPRSPASFETVNFTASITGERLNNHHEDEYEITCKAWRIVTVEVNHGGRRYLKDKEISTIWSVNRSFYEFRDLDKKLRMLQSKKLQTVPFPVHRLNKLKAMVEFSSSIKLDLSKSRHSLDQYLQEVLCVISINSNGREDCGALQYNENATGIATQKSILRRSNRANRSHSAEEYTEVGTPPKSDIPLSSRSRGWSDSKTEDMEQTSGDDLCKTQHRHHHHHNHHSHHSDGSKSTKDNDTSSAEIRARIAKVGRKLIFDALTVDNRP